jgi:hypothetical protein
MDYTLIKTYHELVHIRVRKIGKLGVQITTRIEDGNHSVAKIHLLNE